MAETAKTTDNYAALDFFWGASRGTKKKEQQQTQQNIYCYETRLD